MKSRSLLLILLLCWSGCSQHKEVETTLESGEQEVYSVLKATNQKDGTYQKTRDGVLLETAEYHQDTLHGVRTLFDPDGNVLVEETYHLGSFEGPYKRYYPNGQVNLMGDYHEGGMHGVWKKYYEDGTLMESVTMENNQESGPFVEYWENGNLKAEGEYIDGDNEHGELLLYDEEGTLEKKMSCNHGICHTIWTKESDEAQ